MKTVCLIPHWETWNNDRLFTGAEGCIYVDAFQSWRQEARHHGFHLIAPESPPKQAPDILWFIDLPRNKGTFHRWTKHWSQRPRTVLHIMESPLLFPHAFHPSNRRCFDAVVSYEAHSSSQPWFHCALPVTPNSGPVQDHPFSARKLAVMVNTNRYEGWLATRKTGLTGLPGIGRLFSGWQIPPWTILNPAAGELYSWRRRLARTAASLPSSTLDIFGPGWSGERISCIPWINRYPYPNAVPITVPIESTVRQSAKRNQLVHYRFTVAAENFCGHRGYISEKIFDAMLAGTVPVYLGEARIRDTVPDDAFVDARSFPSTAELILFLSSMNKGRWLQMREAGRRFLDSSRFAPFLPSAFVATLLSVLLQVSHTDAGDVVE